VQEDEQVFYLPLDLSFIVKKVVRLVNPKVFIMFETEIWPNLIFALSSRKVPIALVNGRISPSSYRGYKTIKPFVKPALKKISLFCMQTKQDALKIISLGAEPDKVKITGNTKFDIETDLKEEKKDIDELSGKLKLKGDDEILIAGSTHYPEEKILFSCYRKLLSSFPKLKLIVVPRHIERTRIIERTAKKYGFRSHKFTELANRMPEKEARLIIVDVLGKLKTLYALATVVFIGGSLSKRGGQNMIEPAVYSKPMIFGPHVYNFQSISESLIDNKAAAKVNNKKQLCKKVHNLLKRPKERKQLGENAHEVLMRSKGAVLKNVKLLCDLVIS
jgi:3-deoxy-D-manno-octulosonic-acid transferase